MNPTVFPYTYMDDEEAQALNQLFGPLHIYLPSAMEMPPTLTDLNRKGLVSLSVPLEDETDKRALRTILAECHTWGGSLDLRAATAGGAQNLKMDEAFAINIRTAILKNSSGQEQEPVKTPLLTDLVFLHMAQNLDAQHFDLERSLKKLKEKEGSLLKELAEPGREEDHKAGVPLSSPGNPRSRYVLRRMKAWAHLMGGDGAPGGIYLTTVSDSIDILLDKTESEPISFQITDFPWPLASQDQAAPWQEAFLACMDDFLSGVKDAPQALQGLEALPSMDSSKPGEGATLKVFLVEESPKSFFSRCLELDLPEKQSGSAKNTVLVCLE